MNMDDSCTLMKCVTLFSKALLKVVLNPNEAGEFIVKKQFINEASGLVSTFFYLTIKSELTLKGLPEKYYIIHLKIEPSAFDKFLMLGSYDFPLLNGNEGKCSSDVKYTRNPDSCRVFLTRRIRSLPGLIYSIMPFMWFIIRHYETSRGILRITLIVPYHQVNLSEVNHSDL